MTSQSRKGRAEAPYKTIEEFYEKERSGGLYGRILVSACAAPLFIADLIAYILLAGGGMNPVYTVYGFFLIIADGVFCALAFFTDFRFKYSLKIVVWYLILSAFFLAIPAISGSSGSRVFTTGGVLMVYWGHLLALAVIMVAAVFFARTNKFSLKKSAIVLGIMLVFGAGYITFNFTAGFFGQGFNVFSDRMTLEYTLKDGENGSYYTVTGAVGRGSKIIIEDTFNGREVGEINCNVFATPGLRSVEIKTDRRLSFYNYGQSSVGSLTVTVSRELVDEYRAEFLNKEESGLFAAFVPRVSSGEVYVTFGYDFANTPLELTRKFIPTYIGNKGDALPASLFADYEKYLERADDLEYHYYHTGKYFLNSLEGIDAPLNAPIKNLEMDFERVHLVNIGWGNNGVQPADWVDIGFISETKGNVNLNPVRPGCAVTWRAMVQPDVYGTVGNNLDSLRYYADFWGMDEITLKPTWQVIQPHIEKLITDSATGAFTYGDTVGFNTTAAPHGLQLEYSLNRYGQTLEKNNTGVFGIDGLTPLDSGTYTVVARATDIYDPELYSETSKNVYVTVNKKQLSFDWDVPDGVTYDGTAKPVNAACITAPVGADVIDYYLSFESVIDAGTYTSEIVLDWQTESYYEVASDSLMRTFTVEKRPVTPIWDIGTYVYDGYPHAPYISGVIGEVAGHNTVMPNLHYPYIYPVNAGVGYTISAYTTALNYVLTGETSVTYDILPAEITGVTWGALTSAYNGSSYHPAVVALTGAIVAGERDQIINSLVYHGAEINAGDYTAEVTLPQGNYVFASRQTTPYTITKRNLTVIAGHQSKSYDGQVYTAFTAAGSNLGGADTLAQVGTVTYGGSAVTAVNYSASGYVITPVIEAHNQGPKYGNYNISYQSGTLMINKSELTIVKGTNPVLTKVYDGNTSTAFSFSAGTHYTVQGAVAGEITGVNYTAAYNSPDVLSASGVNVTFGALVTGAGYLASNYTYVEGKVLNYTASITPLAVTADWSVPSFSEDFTATGQGVVSYEAGSFPYNGLTQRPTVTASGLDGNILINVSGGIIPGTYTATAQTPDTNYTITNNQYQFKIVKKKILAKWGAADNWTAGSLVLGSGIVPTITFDAGITGVTVASYEYYDSQGRRITSVTAAGVYRAKVNYTSSFYEVVNNDINFTVA